MRQGSAADEPIIPLGDSPPTVVISTTIPDVRSETIKITVAGENLRIHGERNVASSTESSSGGDTVSTAFVRTIALPGTIGRGGFDATVSGDRVTITLPNGSFSNESFSLDEQERFGRLLDRSPRVQEVADLGLMVYGPAGFARFLGIRPPVFGGRSALELLEAGETEPVLAALAADYEGLGF